MAALRRQRSNIAYVFLVLLVGPGLMVHEVLKDQWGRARPAQIVELGGDRQFTPALLPARQCDRNCSFVSGHVATAFMPAALALIATRRRWLWFATGVAFATITGYCRAAAGSHFVSDAVFAMIVVWFSALIVHRLVFGVGPSPAAAGPGPGGQGASAGEAIVKSAARRGAE
jgi:lipid A 4'-phosphatase